MQADQNNQILELKKEQTDKLIKVKDDQLLQLNNFINWGIAIVTILVTLISLGWAWALKKVNDSRQNLDRQLSESNRLINTLKEQNEKIINDQDKINKILSSDYFEEKLNQFENNIIRLNESVKEWELYREDQKEKQFSLERYKLFNQLTDNLRLLSGGSFPDRLTPIEKDRVIEIKNIKKENLSNQELKILNNELYSIYEKHRLDGDDYSYMV